MRNVALFPLALLLASAPLSAQTTITETRLKPVHVYFGGNFIVAEPQQEFGDYINTSFGGSLHVLWKPAPNGVLGLRFEGGGIGYGEEKQRVPLSETVGGRIMVDLTTSNFIGFANVGPQLMAPRGPIRPYLAPTIGFAYIGTVSSVEGVDSHQSFASDVNYDDFLFAYGATGGIYVPLSQGRVPVALDLSARYHQNGKASYLIEGSIHDNADGTITFDPIRSRANLLTFQIGVSIGARASDKKHGLDDD